MGTTISHNSRGFGFELPSQNKTQLLTRVPIANLLDRLANRSDGAGAIRAIQLRQCEFISDVVAISTTEWLRTSGTDARTLDVLYSELATLLSDILSDSARSQNTSILLADSGRPGEPDGSSRKDKKVESHIVNNGGGEPSSHPRAWGDDIPVEALLQALNKHRNGARIKRAIRQKKCRTLADVAAIPDTEWLKVYAFGFTCLATLRLELKRLLDDAGHIRQEQPHSAAEIADASLESESHLTLSLNKVGEIPLSVLIERLAQRGGVAIRAIRAIHEFRLTSIADVLAVDDEQWLQARTFGPGSLAVLKAELAALQAELERLAERKIDSPPSLNGDILAKQSQGGATLYAPESTVTQADKVDGVPLPLSVVEAAQESVIPCTDNARIQSWQDISFWVYRLLDKRQLEIVQRYYGFQGEPQTLEEIGRHFVITRERVRQLKAKAFRIVANKISTYIAASVIWGELGKLAPADRRVTTATVLAQQLIAAGSIPEADAWMLHWFEDGWGPDWWIQRGGSAGQNGFHSFNDLAPVAAVINLADYVSLHSYCPLTIDAALAIAKTNDPSLTTRRLLVQLENDPEIRVFMYGQTQIGHASWKWFNPERARKTRVVEWVMRLTHRLASPGEWAQSIQAHLGEFGVTAFDVAETCEENPAQFFDAGGRYGLRLWQDTHGWRNSITQLLSSGPLTVAELELAWRDRFGEQPTTETLVATLYCHPEQFQLVDPLRWSLAGEAGEDFDPQSCTFEDLLPNL